MSGNARTQGQAPAERVAAERRRVVTVRLRLLAWISIAIVLMFSVASPAMGAEGPVFLALRLGALVFLGACLVASYRPGFAGYQELWGLLMATGIAVFAARGGILRDTIAVTATLDLILVMITAAILPWGLLCQGLVVLITTATTWWAVHSIAAPVHDIGTVFVLINVGAGCLLSLLVAQQTRSSFDRAARENVDLREAQDGIRALNLDLEGKVRLRTEEVEGALADQRAVTHAISHDLRQPLRHIEGYARMLKDDLGGTLDVESLERLDGVRRATVRMGRMVDSLLELSRVSGRLVRRKPVDLSTLAREVGDLLATADSSRRVELVVADGLSADCDPGLARDLLRELLGNAWKFTRGEVEPRVEFGRRDRTWFVRDNGAGFDMEHTRRLFHAFERLHHVSEFEGEGMGLAIAERIVRRHGGRIWAESEPERGATFYFTLHSEG